MEELPLADLSDRGDVGMEAVVQRFLLRGGAGERAGETNNGGPGENNNERMKVRRERCVEQPPNASGSGALIPIIFDTVLTSDKKNNLS